MASQTKNDTLPIAAVFSNLFKNFPRLILTNMIFFVPLAAFTALFWWLSSVVPVDGILSTMLMMLAMIPVFPFYAGVVKITSKMSAGEEKVNIFNNFFSAVKENFLPFLFHGDVLYIVSVFSYVSFSIYLKLIRQNTLFLGPLIVSIIIILFFLFMFFYIPVMTVTFDIPIKYIYKNSFLMSYGEIKKNFIGFLGLFLLMVVSTTLLIACNGSRIAVVIVTILLAALIVPAIASFIIHSAVYQRMYEMITNKSSQQRSVDEKLEKVKNPQQKDEAREEMLESLKSFEIDESLPDDEYVYFNGKMVKKGVLVQLKEEAVQSGKEKKETE